MSDTVTSWLAAVLAGVLVVAGLLVLVVVWSVVTMVREDRRRERARRAP